MRLAVRLGRRDGAFRVLDTVSRNLLHQRAVAAIVTNAHDITDQRPLEEQYHQAHKLESIGRLAGGIAHDFNNLGTAILGYAEFLEAYHRGSPRSLDDLMEIRRAAERARDLTQQLLAFARTQVVSPRTLQLESVVRSVERLIGRLVGEDVEVSTSLAPEGWPIVVDASQLEQVILTLAVDARDGMPDGGRLMIETANQVLDQEYAISHRGVAPGAYAVLIVTDTGKGLSPTVISNIVEPFFTTKAPGRGTGLGLATVYGIVKQNGGHLWVYSAPNFGTTVRIYLPRAREQRLSTQPAPDAIRRRSTSSSPT